jgi:cardiolipin synthase
MDSLPTEGVTVINNRDYYPAVMSLIQSAEKSIELAMHQTRFYEEYPGSQSNNLCDALGAAAERGVEVTFLIDQSADDWNEGNAQHADFGRRLGEHGANVYHDDLNRVTHTKLIIVDGVATVISSVNWSHYALTSNYEVGAIVWGREVAEAANAVVADHVANATLVSGEAMGEFAPVDDDIPAYAAARGLDLIPCEDATLLYNQDYYPAVSNLFESAEEEIDVVQATAYYYRTRPDHAGPVAEGQESLARTNDLIDELAGADARGVDTEIVAEGWFQFEEDEPRQNRNLDIGFRALGEGIEIFWDPEDAQTHAKMVIVDDTSVVGSTNWTVFAVEGINNELSVMLKSDEIADLYRDFAEDLQTRGEAFDGTF